MSVQGRQVHTCAYERAAQRKGDSAKERASERTRERMRGYERPFTCAIARATACARLRASQLASA
eukprot:6208022-Pleurochrysis_carterae.AAC.6